jgi:hypothetical protein
LFEKNDLGGESLKKRLLLILFVSFILVACSEEKTLEFTGEGENWSVTYIAHIHDSDSESIDYTIRYVGDEPGTKTINFNLGNSSETGRTLDTETSSLTGNGNRCSGCSVTQENDEIKATITWNGKSETFTLTSD